MASPASSSLARLTARLPPLRGILPLLLFLLVWEMINPVRSPYFPPPSAWWTSVVELARGGQLRGAIASTLLTFLSGMLIAALTGGTIGVLIGASRHARRASGYLLEFCRALPPPLIVPVAVLLLGYNENLKVIVVTWAAVWPILLNTASATGLVDPVLLDVARTFRLDRAHTIRKIVVPAVVPSFFLGLRVAVPIAIIVTLLVEMLTLLPGIGSLIVVAQREFQSAKVYGLLVIVGIIGFLLNNAFVLIEGIILSRWPPRAADEN